MGSQYSKLYCTWLDARGTPMSCITMRLEVLQKYWLSRRKYEVLMAYGSQYSKLYCTWLDARGTPMSCITMRLEVLQTYWLSAR